ncbi:hypothetical protein Hanom_Chr03g00250581 [Helianthus anomalus]
MSLPRLEPSTFEKRWVSVANWATSVGFILVMLHTRRINILSIYIQLISYIYH